MSPIRLVRYGFGNPVWAIRQQDAGRLASIEEMRAAIKWCLERNRSLFDPVVPMLSRRGIFLGWASLDPEGWTIDYPAQYVE